MKRETVEFAAKDLALREDVSLLGALVGEMLREQGGETLFERVESARRAAIRRRSGNGEAEQDLISGLAGMEAREATEVLRAFSTWFQVVNLAEKVHRVRRRRDYLREAGKPQPFGLEQTLRRVIAPETAVSDVQAFLDRLRIEPVFTAHPSEATRRTILDKQQRMARRLVERFDPSLTVPEEQVAIARIRADLTAGWQTEEHPSVRMSVADEREHVLFYLTDIIYRVVPPFYEGLERTLVELLGETRAREVRVPTLLRFASWVGGDMDGNPNVSARTIRETLAHHRSLVLARYREEVASLGRQLSQSTHLVVVSPEVNRLIRRYAAQFPEIADAVPGRHQDMAYRVALRLIDARLAATAGERTTGYPGAAAFVEDVTSLCRSLEDNRGEHAGLFNLQRLKRRAETFGFHLATLDVRQDAMLHRQVVGRGLADPQWLERSVTERAERLRIALTDSAPPVGPDDDLRASTLDVFTAIADCRKRYGRRAIGPYIVSMSQGADDLLSVLLLARWAGLIDADGNVPLDVTPLFETVEDLSVGPGIMRDLLGDEIYAGHLAARDGEQMVMIGYSDSNKDGGFAASRWALHQAEAEFVAVADDAGVELTLFHGRGGSISRGGSNTWKAVLGAPRGAVNGRLRVTEQGEIIDAKFGLRGTALRTLEQAVAAVGFVTGSPPETDARESEWHAAMTTVAEASRASYRNLIYETPGFVEYFRACTPIDVIERMQIGSRPAARRSGQGIENLRAIPWVFAWTQSRQIVPGWYGLGTGLATAIERHGREIVCDMIARWQFFRSLVADAEMVLAKVDMDIAARYAALGGAEQRPIFDRIRNEFELTCSLLLDLSGHDHLLQNDGTLRRAILLRNPYVDPMSLLQVELLERWRGGGREDPEVLKALLASVNGIAQGLQNTG